MYVINADVKRYRGRHNSCQFFRTKTLRKPGLFTHVKIAIYLLAFNVNVRIFKILFILFFLLLPNGVVCCCNLADCHSLAKDMYTLISVQSLPR